MSYCFGGAGGGGGGAATSGSGGGDGTAAVAPGRPRCARALAAGSAGGAATGGGAGVAAGSSSGRAALARPRSARNPGQIVRQRRGAFAAVGVVLAQEAREHARHLTLGQPL